jgi:FkbM family methyltransferase
MLVLVRTNSMSLAAVSFDQQMKLIASKYSNLGTGRPDSAAYLSMFFHELVDLLQPQLFIEAGAYRADASRHVKARHPECRVVAFEANPYNHQEYVDSLGFAESGIEYLHHAVTDVAGPVTFNLRRRVAGEDMRPITGNSSILKRADPDVEYEEITVDGVTLDGFFPDPPELTALWIDVEGASRQVLNGGSAIIERTDLLLIEVEERTMWTGQWRGLDVIDFLLGHGMVPVSRDIEYERQHNLLFVSRRFYARPDFLAVYEGHLNWMSQQMSVRGPYLG